MCTPHGAYPKAICKTLPFGQGVNLGAASVNAHCDAPTKKGILTRPPALPLGHKPPAKSMQSPSGQCPSSATSNPFNNENNLKSQCDVALVPARQDSAIGQRGSQCSFTAHRGSCTAASLLQQQALESSSTITQMIWTPRILLVIWAVISRISVKTAVKIP